MDISVKTKITEVLYTIFFKITTINVKKSVFFLLTIVLDENFFDIANN